MIFNILLSALEASVEVTGFVILMMAIIEIFNVESKGLIFNGLRNSRFAQVTVASFLGMTPGCMGGYAVTSLYNHRLVGFGALLAMMIATFGDEAYVMIASFPKTALAVMLGVMVFAIVVGMVASVFVKEPAHDSAKECHEMEHAEEKRNWKQFLKENILHHIILHHAPKIFAWTFGVLVLVGFARSFMDIESWVGENTALMVLVAALVGLIPQSGPHMIFVTLFASGVIPLPVLLSSCISQDGHAALPLLAENKKAFIKAKTIKLALALVVGYIALLIGQF